MGRRTTSLLAKSIPVGARKIDPDSLGGGQKFIICARLLSLKQTSTIWLYSNYSVCQERGSTWGMLEDANWNNVSPREHTEECTQGADAKQNSGVCLESEESWRHNCDEPTQTASVWHPTPPLVYLLEITRVLAAAILMWNSRVNTGVGHDNHQGSIQLHPAQRGGVTLNASEHPLTEGLRWGKPAIWCQCDGNKRASIANQQGRVADRLQQQRPKKNPIFLDVLFR